MTMDTVDGIDAAGRRRLFLLANLAIFMIGLGFAVRANIAADLQRDLFDVLDLARSAAMVGEVIGATFIGFALTLLFGSALLDRVGMKAMLVFSAVGYLVGSLLVVGASLLGPDVTSYWLVYSGLLLTGLLLGPLLSVPMLLGLRALQPVLLAGACAVTVGLYLMTLRYATRLFGQRRDQLIDSLKTVR